jgi:hypothetical protein
MAASCFPQTHAFGPDEIKVLTTAFEDALGTLRLANRGNPSTEIVAKRIIDAAKNGERDPDKLCEYALEALGFAAYLQRHR